MADPRDPAVEPDKPDILVVDDTATNLAALTEMLRGAGYRVRPVLSGRLALRAAEAEPPDLILLDINMPELDGYEVCARLKRHPSLRNIPVIFISALTDTLDKVKAFGAGGVDYVVKPFEFEEVRARVETHLTLRRLVADLEQRHAELRRLEQLRDNLIHMIVHDLRSPLTGIKGFLDLLVLTRDELTGFAREGIDDAAAATSSMIEMISSLLDVSRLEAAEMPLTRSRSDLARIARDAISSLGSITIERTVAIDAPEPVTADCDPAIVRRIIANLVSNAVKFTPEGKPITVAISRREGSPRVEVRDEGPGIPLQYRDRVFEKFVQVEARSERNQYSTGLGLTFCKLAVLAHGGRIGLESEVGVGTTFWFELPRLDLSAQARNDGPAEASRRGGRAAGSGVRSSPYSLIFL